MDARHGRVLEHFRALCDLEPDEQERRLAADCDDESVRAEVREMLAADRQPSELLKRPDPTHVEALFDRALGEAASDPATTVPEHIGSYRVVGLLGAGGMGAVYEAEQESPNRRVAIKVLRAGYNSDEGLARFTREGRVLGQLKHVGIARIYEAGTWDSPAGPQPFLAMELIEGVPLDEFVATERLDLAARLELVIALCAAVQHAHEKGVLHRDLKPSNVLVTPEGRPVVLDFGVARGLYGSDQTHATHTGELIGSLRTMSPEQAAGAPNELDARSDVYALGVMLYELLAGQAPYELGSTPLHQAARIILEDEPTRLGLLDRRLAGDLETIARKALEKDRERRYESVAALARDLRRHLSDQPIDARPPSAAYRLTKFTRRNRWLVAGAASTLAALILGLVGTTLFALRASDRAQEAFDARTDALAAAGKARAAEASERKAAQQARREAIKAVAVRDLFLDTLREAQPVRSNGRAVTVVEALASANERMLREGLDDPEFEYSVRRTQATIHTSLGDFNAALEHTRAALAAAEAFAGTDSPEFRSARFGLGFTLNALGDRAGAKAEYLALLLDLGGDDELGGDKVHYTALGGLGQLYLSESDFATAQGYLERATRGLRRLGDDGRDELAVALQRCSQSCMMLGLSARALEEAEAAYRLAQEVGLETFSFPLDFGAQYANVLDGAGRVEEAIELYAETLRQSQDWYPSGRKPTYMLRFNMALAQQRQGRFDEALENLTVAFDGLRAADGRHDDDALLVAHGMLVTLGSAGRSEQALVWYDENLSELPENYYGWLLRLVRGQLLTEIGAYEEALALLAQAYAGLSQELPPGNAHLSATLAAQINCSDALGQDAESERFAALREQHLDAAAAQADQ